MKKKAVRKLQLHRETVRQLENLHASQNGDLDLRKLDLVAGGGDSCPCSDPDCWGG